jgi:tetratricopeptide (TPR) repeat protein
MRFHLLGFWLGLVACGVHALVDFPLRLPASAAMFWLFAGILLGFGTISRKNKLTLTMRRPYQLVVAVTGIISLLISLFFYKAYLSANNDLYHALVNLQKGNCVAAAQHSQQGFETFAFDFMLHTAHAQIYSFCNFPPQQKLEAMNRVLKHDPTNMRARLTRAVLYSEANRPDLAIPEFQVIAKILPHQPYAYMGLGDSARQQGDRIKARFYYQAALKRKPDYQYVKEQLSRLNAEAEQQK